MCGICGIVEGEAVRPVDEAALRAMSASLTHRGPDDSGSYLSGGVGLGARRLAILDLSANGHMPMHTPDRRYWITYNGEVYNYRELRSGLEARGYVFRSRTDTEVVLNLYAEQGPAMLDRLNGMFAFGIWDTRDRTLFLARDRLGVKPLYYALQGSRLLFASEEKALFAAGFRAAFDTETWEELLCFRYVAGTQTPFVGVKRLLPGHCLTWKDGRIQIRRWWNLAERVRELSGTPMHDPVGWFRETFDDSVRLRRISDVPVGVLLSGGLDSGSVAASLGSQSAHDVASFTVRFAEPEYDEGPLAQQVAQRWRLKFHERTISPAEIVSGLHEVSYLNDEPLTHGNDLHLWAISRYAKSLVTVLLSGEGADETLGGYVRYRPLRYSRALWAGRSAVSFAASVFPSRSRLRKLARLVALDRFDRWVLFNACDVLPEDLPGLGMNPKAWFPYREQVVAEAVDLYPGDLLRQAMYSDQHTFLCSILDRNDRMTMGASIECRVPFLDYRLVEGLAALPSSVLLAGYRNKYLLRRSVGARLPKAVQKHRKWGFGVPWSKYLREIPELREQVIALPDSEPIRSGPFVQARVRNIVGGFLSGEREFDALIRQLFMITVWYTASVTRSAICERARAEA